MDAVAEVWASILGPDPIEYRRERGLQEFVEEMGILIQEVVGTRVGRWWLPAFAGVAFSLNEFRWSPRIRREDGLIRLVPGPGHARGGPGGRRLPGAGGARAAGPARQRLGARRSLRYSPRRADVINLETNRFETVDLAGPAAGGGRRVPAAGARSSRCCEDGHAAAGATACMMDPDTDDLVADMEGLLADTDFVAAGAARCCKTLEEYLGTPVDIEFAHDGKDFYLLQCRPQADDRRHGSGGDPARRAAGRGSCLHAPTVSCPTAGCPDITPPGLRGAGGLRGACRTPRPCVGWAGSSAA